MARRVTESITSSTSCALVAEILGDRQRDKTGADAQRRGPVRGRDDHHGPLPALSAQVVFEKRAHLAVALADQRDHADVRRIVARHGAEQRALADAAAAENPDALAFAARQQAVDGADAGDQRLGDMRAVERVRRRRW